MFIFNPLHFIAPILFHWFLVFLKLERIVRKGKSLRNELTSNSFRIYSSRTHFPYTPLVLFEIILFTDCCGVRFLGPHSTVRHFTMTQNYAASWLNTVHRFTPQLTPITRHQHTNAHN